MSKESLLLRTAAPRPASGPGISAISGRVRLHHSLWTLRKVMQILNIPKFTQMLMVLMINQTMKVQRIQTLKLATRRAAFSPSGSLMSLIEGMMRVGSSGVEDEPNPEGTDKPSSEVGEEKPAEVNIPNIPKNESK